MLTTTLQQIVGKAVQSGRAQYNSGTSSVYTASIDVLMEVRKQLQTKRFANNAKAKALITETYQFDTANGSALKYAYQLPRSTGSLIHRELVAATK